MHAKSFYKSVLLLFLFATGNILAVSETTTEHSANSPKAEAMAQLNEKLTNWVAKVYNEIPDLTPEQQEKLTPIFAKQFFENMVFHGKMKKLRAEGASRKELRALREEMGDPKKHLKKIKNILTKEQFKSYQAFMKKMGSKRQNGQRGGKQGGGRQGGGRGQNNN